MLPNAWQIPEKPGIVWRSCSFTLIAILSRVTRWTFALNQNRIYNIENLKKALDRSKHVGLVTLTNHHTIIDDPYMWGTIDAKNFTMKRWRWSLVADNVCFTNKFYSIMFSLGKNVPVCRGDGVYQKGMDFCIDKLNKGEWINIFPEGKVILHKEVKNRLKWGIGRLIAEANITPVVLPIYHFGFDSVMPNKRPYWLNMRPIRQKTTIVVGEPIDCTEILKKLKKLKKTPVEIRKEITDMIQEQFHNLGEKTKLLHEKHLTDS